MRKTLLASLLFAACAPAPAEVPTLNARAPLLTDAMTPSEAILDFEVGWVQVQRGALVQGGHVDVTYNQARMSDCSAPTVISSALFQPGGQLFSSDEALGFDVPADATSVGLWFQAVAPGCEQWDSNYGSNWTFPVVATAPAAVGWAGDWGSSTDRSCVHVAGVPQPLAIDEYMREEACIFIDADVWVSGVTDIADPHPEWIQAQVQWAKDDSPPTQTWLDYEGIVGNNARFRWSVPYDLRDMVDWNTASYSFQFSTDGNTWLNVAQPSGDDWTITRDFMFSLRRAF
jgi:hypothetical protein